MSAHAPKSELPRAEKAKAKLGSLEVGRGIAALAVVMHHAGQASDAFTSSDYGGLFHWGMYGVDFFFVLSGFIIYHVHQKDRLDASAAPSFLIKRLRRIYIPYLPVTIVLIAAYLALPGLSEGNREWGWFTSLTLLPSEAPQLYLSPGRWCSR
jgi:peptidoglycan/LPS O-acetylase OafA/YrhL